MLTNKQSKAFHLNLRNLVKDLNDAGYDVEQTLRETWKVPWTEELAKQILFRNLAAPMFGVTSHRQLTTEELNTWLETLQDNLPAGISTQFPSVDSLAWEGGAYDRDVEG